MAVNLHKKQHWASSKFYWFSWKAKGYWMNFKIHRISKDKKVNKLWRKLLHQITLNAKSRFVWEKEKHTIISQISWCRLDTFVNPCRWNLQLESVFQIPLSRSLVIVGKEPSTLLAEWHFRKKITKTAKSFWSKCSLIPLFLNKKWKWKHGISFQSTFISFKRHL